MSQFHLAESDQSPLAAAIRLAIGASATESVEVMTPEFNRPASWTPAMLPPSARDHKAWSGFTAADRDTLREWGCRAFGAFTTEPHKDAIQHVDSWFFETDDKALATHELWLFPAEWYDAIPNGFPVTDIFGCIESFERGKTDDDRRFGCLAYGVMVALPLRATPGGKE